MVREEINQILDRLPEEELEGIVVMLGFIEANYLFRKNLIEKGVIITELYAEAQDIHDSWDRAFVQIDEETKKSIYYDQFKWHMFSYGKQDCLKEDEARAAFHAIPKDELYGMYQRASNVVHYGNAGRVVASDFDSEQDIYLFDTSFTWTYIHTHESECGPYFYHIKMNSAT